MTILSVTFDTQAQSVNGINSLIQGGQIIQATGILNRRWDEYSALEIAEESGLVDVTWDCVYDDTPSTLELTIWYPHLSINRLQERIELMPGIEDYDLQSDA